MFTSARVLGVIGIAAVCLGLIFGGLFVNTLYQKENPDTGISRESIFSNEDMPFLLEHIQSVEIKPDPGTQIAIVDYENVTVQHIDDTWKVTKSGELSGKFKVQVLKCPDNNCPGYFEYTTTP